MVAQVSLLARGATRRDPLSYPQRLPTLETARLQPLSDCFALSLDRLDTSVSRSFPLHAFHSELSAPPDNKSGFQCSVTRSRLRYHVVTV